MGVVIGSTDQSKVNEEKLRGHYFAIVGAFAPKKIEKVVEELEAHFEKTNPDGLVQCDVCYGWSDNAALSECPYCGSTDSEEASAKTGAAEVPQIVDEVFDETEIDASKIEALEEESARKPRKAKRATTEEVAERKMVRRPPSVPRPSSAPAISILAGGRSQLATEKELDEEIARFVEAGEATAANNYRMGVSLLKIRDGLWQQRKENGKPKYKSFEQFVATELLISRSLATSLQNVVTNFSRDQFDKFGITALKWIGSAPKEDRPLLLAMAEGGASSREIQDEVTRIRDEKNVAYVEQAAGATATAAARGGTGFNGHEAPAPVATIAAAKARRANSAAITIGLKQEQITVKMLARAKRGEDERPARSLEDQPYATIECTNGTKLYFAIKTRPTGELELKMTAKRDKE